MEIRRMLCVALLLPLYCYADLSISGEYDADSAPPAAHIEKQPENGVSGCFSFTMCFSFFDEHHHGFKTLFQTHLY